MLLSGIFTKAVMYIMLLCDSIIAGQIVGQTGIATRAALFVEEIGLTVMEQNKGEKKPVLIELSLYFENDSVLIIERDSGKLFDITEPDLRIEGLSSMILAELMEAQKEKAYLVTTGYNRNMIRFRREDRPALGAN